MALLLAPYNDSMRLGMGFNSYTQTMCIDGAVKVEDGGQVRNKNPSQVVTYSSKFVEKLSDIVSSMHISYSSAIRKGTIEVSGNGNTIDEDKIKASDVNLVVSVQVINQTIALTSSAKFVALKDVKPGSVEFNDAFGDCYISGFIEGGDFNSIISMRCNDRTKSESTVKAIKRMARASEPNEFTMDSYTLNSSLSSSDALKDTETTISVNWTGGGQIKEPTTSWDIDSVYAAAAAFPDRVAKTPQRTWAILTKYKANREFNEWALGFSLRPLEYDAVTSYTAELFNSYMEYKQLIKKVQKIIVNRDHYIKSSKPNALPTTVTTLVAVRQALRNEMNKIVAVVNVLSRHPELLQQESSFGVVSKDDLVRQIMEGAIAASPDTKVILDTTASPAKEAGSVTNAETSTATKANVGGPTGTKDSTPASMPITASSPKLPDSKSAASTGPTSGASESRVAGVKIDLSNLVAPEVWADVLPVPNVSGGTNAINADTPTTDAASNAAATAALRFPAPPKDDTANMLAAKSATIGDPSRLTVHRAVCGIHDVTTTVRSRIVDNKSFSIKYADIDTFIKDPVYSNSFTTAFIKNLSILYQYGEGPLRLFSADWDWTVNDKAVEITAKSDHAKLIPRDWNEESFAIVAIVYGGRVFNDDTSMKRVEDMIGKDYKLSSMGLRRITFDSSLLDMAPGISYPRTGVIFYREERDVNAPIKAVVGIEGGDCASISLQPQLLASTTLYSDLSRQCVFFERGCFTHTGGQTIITFPNRLTISLAGSGDINCLTPLPPPNKVHSLVQGGATDPKIEFKLDGQLYGYSRGELVWSSNTAGRGKQLMLASTAPHLAIVDDNKKVIWDSNNFGTSPARPVASK